MQPERYLEGRVAIVSGGFSGIGKAIVRALAERGAMVAVGARRQLISKDELFASNPSQIFCHALDVRDSNSIEKFTAATADHFGEADILVNSAGVSTHELVCEHDEASWEQVIDTNLSGPFRMIRRCMPAMKASGWGRIINIGSTAARSATADHAAYCASKSGLVGLTRAVALEGAAFGISAVVLSPTWVETEMFHHSMLKQAKAAGHSVEQEMALLIRQAPQNRLVQPAEIGSLAAFLCHQDAQGITMEDIQINAGSHW